jgi:opacity protein-like surface antigen
MGGEWMMAKFASVTASVTATASVLTLLVTILLGAQGFAQTAPPEQTPAAQAPAAEQPATPPSATPAPATQAPAAQQPSTGQEPSDEISSSARRKKPHDYKNWNFNVGAGANLDSGSTRTWVRGGGPVGAAGVARNANKYLGLRADVVLADLPLRDSTEELAQSTGARNYAYAITLNPIINLPVTKLYSGYFTFGGGFFHRSGSLSGSTAVPGSPCNEFWSWWGACINSNAFIPLSGNFVNSSLNQWGYDVGGGVARKMPSGVEIYLEYRLMHGTASNITTDFRPITIGFRW